jgi:hypothetical protein
MGKGSEKNDEKNKKKAKSFFLGKKPTYGKFHTLFLL